MLNIFSYTDYRMFLRDWYESKKAKNPAFSFRSLAKRSRAIPHSTFWMVMKGERSLTAKSLPNFVATLGLSGKEALYFEALVFFNQARGWNLKQRQLERIVEMRENLDSQDVRIIRGQPEMDLHGTWYAFPILVMMELENFRDDPAWIAAQLGAKVTESQVRTVLDALLLHGIVVRKDGRLTKVTSRLEIAFSSSKAWSPALPFPECFQEMAPRSVVAMRELPMSEIAATLGTFVASEEDIPLVRERLVEMTSELNALLDKRSKGKGSIYQLTTTFFPLLETGASKRKTSR